MLHRKVSFNWLTYFSDYTNVQEHTVYNTVRVTQVVTKNVARRLKNVI